MSKCYWNRTLTLNIPYYKREFAIRWVFLGYHIRALVAKVTKEKYDLENGLNCET